MAENTKTYHHGDLRNALIEAGIRIVNEQGMAACSLRKVAAFCGVSHAAPYAHFKSKDELLAAMQAHVTERFMEAFQELLKNNPGDEELILKLGRKYVEFFAENPNYYMFLFAQDCFQIDLTPTFAETESYAPFEIFKKCCLNLLAAAGVSTVDSRNTIMSAWAIVHGLAGMATMPSVRFDGDWGQVTEEILLGMEHRHEIDHT